MKRHWLLKSEPSCYSIGDLERDGEARWTGVRNYQARNFLKDMKKGDLALFYHSSSGEVGVCGVVEISSEAAPDETALDPKDDNYDPKATKDNPIWYAPAVRFVRRFEEPVPLGAIKAHPALEGIMVAQRGSRLSVQPVSEEHFKVIERLGA